MNRFSASVSLVASAASLVLAFAPALGCNAGREPTSPVGGIEAPYKPPQLTTTGHDTHVTVEPPYNMYYGVTVREICKGPDPYFAFDASQPDTAAQPTLQTLVSCMKDGPLKDRRISLTGRTDPRGSENYNEKLGLERAERVKRYLVANGIDPARIDTRSLGKTDASPAPQDWASDRRVQIELVK
jgi:outer membrane protein OmpA-like peptidoglycan-associated protein